jgi:hypothetical protein
MTDQTHGSSFECAEGFTPEQVVSSLGLGPLEQNYEELFAIVLEDGVITPEERAQLSQAAERLGLDPNRLLSLEEAMVAAYQARHNVQVVEHQYPVTPSWIPRGASVSGEAPREVLLQEIVRLNDRIRDLEEALWRAQGAINVEVDVSDATTSGGRVDTAEAHWQRICKDPTNPEVVRSLYRRVDLDGDADRRWCVSQALVLLDAATTAERDVFERGRGSGLIAPRSSVSVDAWSELLLHPEQDRLTGQIFSLVAPAVLLGRVTALRRSGSLYQPEAANRQNTETSTVTAVRALKWAAAILGVFVPAVFVEKERDADYVHLLGIPPMTAVGARALTGRSSAEHAFLAGRHLAYYRHEHYVRQLFNAIPHLEDVFLAALAIGSPGLPMADDVRRRVLPLAEAFEPLLEPTNREGLRRSFLEFVEAGGKTNLQRFSLAVDKTTCRAGMLLCNDLTLAASILAREEGPLGELTKDLILFVTSDSYAELRQRLGVRAEEN